MANQNLGHHHKDFVVESQCLSEFGKICVPVFSDKLHSIDPQNFFTKVGGKIVVRRRWKKLI